MTVASLRATWEAFNEDKAQRLAASIAYSTIFALAPLFVILISVVGSLGVPGTAGHLAAEHAVLDAVRRDAGDAAAESVKRLIESSFDKPRQSLLAQIVGWIFFVVGASGLFASLQDALNAVWRVEATKGGWRHAIRARGASFGMIVVVAFLLLVTFLANAVIAFVGAHFMQLLPVRIDPVAIALADQALNLLVIAAVFAAVFKILPDVSLSWRDVWTGAAVTSVLFVIGEALISLYIAYGGVASAYGAAGSILVALVWIYYSALILLLGAEYTKIHAHEAALLVASDVRALVERPAGTDPRDASSRNATLTAVSTGTEPGAAKEKTPSSR